MLPKSMLVECDKVEPNTYLGKLRGGGNWEAVSNGAVGSTFFWLPTKTAEVAAL